MLHLRPKNPQFPSKLTDIPSPPSELYVISDTWGELIDLPALAVVGSRRLSPYGRAVTVALVRAIAARGVVIVSGLALGIDSVAHQAALDAGGRTVAVLPCGLDEVYPSSHTGLARQIVTQGGALVSEYPPKTPAFKTNFVARNRLIAGLGDALLVTEAAVKSGSLHTVNFALAQGKDVLAVPGPINSPGSAGCNNLIKTGATPITDPGDIFNAMKLQLTDAVDHEFTAANASEHAILSLLKKGITDGETLFEKSDLSFSDYQQTLSMLEITGKIRATGGDTWALS